MNSNIAIKVEEISKKYFIGIEKDNSLRGTLASLFRSNSKNKDEFWAIKNISFEVNRGDVVGIIGKNGAGKSTLLKILSQITKPTEGSIAINGRIASLLEVGTGFHPELTGRENIYLNGTILGMTRKEVKAKFDEIVAFSGIEKFIDTPVKHYSSGMYVRLAFSVAAHLEPEILVIDEVLAVGDAEFQKKCLGKMKDVAQEGRTVLFVSHDLGAVKKLCTRTIVLEKGNIMFDGDTNLGIEQYTDTVKQTISYKSSNNTSIPIAFKDIVVCNDLGMPTTDFLFSENICFKFNFYVNNEEAFDYELFVIIKDEKDNRLIPCETKISNKTMTLTLEGSYLARGEYSIHAFIHIHNIRTVDVVDSVCSFRIFDNESPLERHGAFDYGKFHIPFNWQINN